MAREMEKRKPSQGMLEGRISRGALVDGLALGTRERVTTEKSRDSDMREHLQGLWQGRGAGTGQQ